MMRNLLALLTVALLLWLPVNLSAEEKEKPVGLAERLQDLKLTEEQETQIAEIRKECRPQIEKAAKELHAVVKEEVDKVRDVLTDEQKKTLADHKAERKLLRGDRLVERLAHLRALDLTEAERAKIMDIRKEYHPKVVKVMQGFRSLLSDEQRKSRAEGLKAGKTRREVLASLKLTDAQKEKVEAIGKEVHALVREELEKIQDVLTESQKEKLDEFKAERRARVRDRMAHRIAHMKELNLTDEQKSQIAKIRREYRPKVHEAGNKLRAAIREEVRKIHAALKS